MSPAHTPSGITKKHWWGGGFSQSVRGGLTHTTKRGLLQKLNRNGQWQTRVFWLTPYYLVYFRVGSVPEEEHLFDPEAALDLRHVVRLEPDGVKPAFPAKRTLTLSFTGGEKCVRPSVLPNLRCRRRIDVRVSSTGICCAQTARKRARLGRAPSQNGLLKSPILLRLRALTPRRRQV